jgi:hypothetical protein
MGIAGGAGHAGWAVKHRKSLLGARRGRRQRPSSGRTIGLLWLALGCATSVAISAQESANGNVATAIRTLEHAWYEAQAHNDNRALDLIFDNDLVYIEYGRLVTKGEYLSRVKSTKEPLPQIVMEATTVRTFGRTAIVVGSYRETSMNNGRAGLKRWRFIDTWAYKGGRWMLVAAAAVPMSK